MSNDFTLDALADDATKILNELTRNQYPKPDVLLVGHSMGGPVVSRMAEIEKYLGRYIGIVLIDVYGNMTRIIHENAYQLIVNRPPSFNSFNEAIDWALKTKFLCNLESAAISIPALLVQDNNEVDKKLHWKTDLRVTSKFWYNWFENFSQTFLALMVPKLILISDVQLLDDQLTKAQIQGKFQLKLIPGQGHLLHEEQPWQVALTIMGFLERLMQGGLKHEPFDKKINSY
jgi:protein phosphatase methylesterase 1